MSESSKNTTRDGIPAEFAALGDALRALPESDAKISIENSFAKVLEAAARRRRTLFLVQEALSQLRLDLKYLMFDLEATRRERDQYRRRLEERGD
jgi:hypothetical protein